nr:MAG TPA: hypothetical protein [Caudoviricetes sp.]
MLSYLSYSWISALVKCLDPRAWTTSIGNL